jgi:hypothetical protein
MLTNTMNLHSECGTVTYIYIYIYISINKYKFVNFKRALAQFKDGVPHCRKTPLSRKLNSHTFWINDPAPVLRDSE